MIFFVALLECTKAKADMLTPYPKKFSFSGLIEVSYNDYLYQIPSLGKNTDYHTSFIQQTYGIGVGGFIYHPRLAVFTGAIKFRDNRQLAGVGGKVNSQVYGGQLSTYVSSLQACFV